MSAMSKLEPEWQVVRATAMQLFQGDLSEGTVQTWLTVLPDLDYDQMVAAMQRMSADGQVFMPRLGEFAKYLPQRGPRRLSWPEVWGAIEQGCRRCRGKREAADRVEELTGSQRAAAFTAAVWDRVQRAPLGDDNGGAIVASFRKEWEAFDEAGAEQVRRGLPERTVQEMLGGGGHGERQLARPDFAVIAGELSA